MKRILIIEDDPIIAQIYRTQLQNGTFSVEICNDGQTGFERIHEVHPDAILLDLMLPRMNGLEILKQIRAQSQFAAVPIVVLTNAYLPNTIQEAAAAGATHIHDKATLKPRQILESLHLLLECEEDEPSANGPASSRQVPSPPPPPPAAKNIITPSQPWGSGSDQPGSPPPPSNYGYNADCASSSSASIKRANADDLASDAELYRTFLEAKPQTLADLRNLLQRLHQTTEEAARGPHLLELYGKVHALTGSAGMVKMIDIAQVASALEVLVKDLHEHPKHINASTLRSVNQSLELIGELFNTSEPRYDDPPTPNILVVDDEILSRRAIEHALEKGKLKSVSVEDPMSALNLVKEYLFDLIVLDVQMPNMDGFELCTKIRALPCSTPVLFVTGLSDFKSRAKATMSGGTDFIAKPFLFIEITLKALTLILRSRLPTILKCA
jgi:CheY-like chemotaxis protein